LNRSRPRWQRESSGGGAAPGAPRHVRRAFFPFNAAEKGTPDQPDPDDGNALRRTSFLQAGGERGEQALVPRAVPDGDAQVLGQLVAGHRAHDSRAGALEQSAGKTSLALPTRTVIEVAMRRNPLDAECESALLDLRRPLRFSA